LPPRSATRSTASSSAAAPGSKKDRRRTVASAPGSPRWWGPAPQASSNSRSELFPGAPQCAGSCGLGEPNGLVMAERDRGARPAGRGLRETHGGAEVAPSDRRVALDRPAVEVGLREFFRYVPEGTFRHLAEADEPAPGLRQ